MTSQASTTPGSGYFARQLNIPDLDNSRLQQSTALVLGVGGLGCTISMDLCRLGIKRLLIVDYDTVDETNLNRQILYSKLDVNQPKINSALKALKLHNIQTEIYAFNCDVIKNWSLVVQLAKTACVVFNCIDFGEYFDLAVTSLCKSLKLHYLTGSSYGHTAISESFPYIDTQSNGGACWGCNNKLTDLNTIFQLIPAEIQKLPNLEFIPKEVMYTAQQTGSSILPCSLASHLVVTCWVNTFCGYSMPHWSSFTLSTFENFSFPVEQSEDCMLCLAGPSDTEYNLYINSNHIIPLLETDGSTYQCCPGSVKYIFSEELKSSAYNRLKPIHSESANMDIYLTAPPSCDLSYTPTPPNDSFPVPLAKPLIKYQHGNTVAYLSGKRSAILPYKGKLYRLKGCGLICECKESSDLAIFKTSADIPGQNEIKGCSFYHTSLRELYMTELIAKCLQTEGFVCANTSVGMWKYNYNGEDIIPEINKYCSLFETHGDKRLATHVLNGITRLLPHMIKEIAIDEALQLFPEGRIIYNNGDIDIQPTWSVYGLNKVFKSAPVSINHNLKIHHAPTNFTEFVSFSWRAKWSKMCSNLTDYIKDHGDTPLLTNLYHNLGFEVGCIVRILHSNNINWGSFIDHNQCEPHCNCHPNNLMVLPEGYLRFLAPIDFDLSFTRDGFFSQYSGGSYDSEQFDDWLAMEHVEMGRILGGENVNTGVKVIDDISLPKSYRFIETALRDTLVLGYELGVSGCENPHISSEIDRKAMRYLIELALIITDGESC